MNKFLKFAVLIFAGIIVAIVGGYFYLANEISYGPQRGAQIVLYGETHGCKKFYEIEYETWKNFYDRGMRHLFIEDSYSSAQFLNIWMKESDDSLLMKRYEETAGTQSHNEWILEFYRKIKKDCPETVFHGTDVEHQYKTTGERYLKYLEEIGKKDSEEYKIAQINIEQGKKYYEDSSEHKPENYNHSYRENAMAQNFIEQYEKLRNEKIMGIYGCAHTDPRKNGWNTENDSMAKQLKKHFGDIVSYQFVGNVWDYIKGYLFERITLAMQLIHRLSH